jgi:hypothetical protein
MKAGGTSGGMTEAHQDREKRLNLGFRLRGSSVVMQFQRCFARETWDALSLLPLHYPSHHLPTGFAFRCLSRGGGAAKFF